MTASRRLWSEFVPYPDLKAPALAHDLASRDLGLWLAVLPPDRPHVAEVMETLQAAGVAVGLWPMIDDADGRWLNARNVVRFRAHALAVLDLLDGAGIRPDGVAFDLEPDIAELRRVLRGRPPRRVRAGDREAMERAVVEMVREVHARGSKALATLPPPFLFDGASEADAGFARFFGLPLRAGFDEVNVMLYRTLAEGYLPLLGRDAVRRLLFDLAATFAHRFGARASVSIGIAGRGAIGDEASYRDLDELEDDVALVRAAGIDALVLHDLAGVLARERPSAWLDALVATEAALAPPKPSRRAKLVTTAGRTLSALLAKGVR